MPRSALLALSVLLLAAPAVAQDKATIQQLNETWMAAFNRGDPAAIAALYPEDAYVLPAGGDMVKGRQAIEGFWKQALQQLADGKLTAVDVQPLGPDAAREIGTFSFKAKGQQANEVTGKYVVVWRKVGADWKLATDIWNMNK